MKIIITDSNFQSDQPEREVLRQISADVERHHCISEDDIIAIAANADALLVQFAPVTRRVLENLTKCKIIVRYGIGVDNVDFQAAKEMGIKVCNVPTYCLEEVADHTAALIMTLARKIIPLYESVKQGKWEVEAYAKPLLKPEQAAVGLIGVGRIGERVARRLQAFHYQIVAYDPYLSDERAAQLSIRRTDSVQQLLRGADFVSLHVPLTEQTKRIINRQSIQWMKPTAYIVNTSRGALIDTAALAEGIKNGQIAGAALDVFEEEPLPANHPLRACEQVILTPHAAYYSDSAILELQRQAAEEIVREFTNQKLNSHVNR